MSVKDFTDISSECMYPCKKKFVKAIEKQAHDHFNDDETTLKLLKHAKWLYTQEYKHYGIPCWKPAEHIINGHYSKKKNKPKNGKYEKFVNDFKVILKYSVKWNKIETSLEYVNGRDISNGCFYCRIYQGYQNGGALFRFRVLRAKINE